MKGKFTRKDVKSTRITFFIHNSELPRLPEVLKKVFKSKKIATVVVQENSDGQLIKMTNYQVPILKLQEFTKFFNTIKFTDIPELWRDNGTSSGLIEVEGKSTHNMYLTLTQNVVTSNLKKRTSLSNQQPSSLKFAICENELGEKFIKKKEFNKLLEGFVQQISWELLNKNIAFVNDSFQEVRSQMKVLPSEFFLEERKEEENSLNALSQQQILHINQLEQLQGNRLNVPVARLAHQIEREEAPHIEKMQAIQPNNNDQIEEEVQFEGGNQPKKNVDELQIEQIQAHHHYGNVQIEEEPHIEEPQANQLNPNVKESPQIKERQANQLNVDVDEHQIEEHKKNSNANIDELQKGNQLQIKAQIEEEPHIQEIQSHQPNKAQVEIEEAPIEELQGGQPNINEKGYMNEIGGNQQFADRKDKLEEPQGSKLNAPQKKALMKQEKGEPQIEKPKRGQSTVPQSDGQRQRKQEEELPIKPRKREFNQKEPQGSQEAPSNQRDQIKNNLEQLQAKKHKSNNIENNQNNQELKARTNIFEEKSTNLNEKRKRKRICSLEEEKSGKENSYNGMKNLDVSEMAHEDAKKKKREKKEFENYINSLLSKQNRLRSITPNLDELKKFSPAQQEYAKAVLTASFPELKL